MTQEEVARFRDLVYAFYRDHGRHDLPWRLTVDPYAILVSEVMLQQTQVERVRDKYLEFLRVFPDFPSLAAADLKDVLACWRGLGYNRRALALKSIAAIVMERHGGQLPQSVDAIRRLPGIGRYTAGAIAAFAFNMPSVFIETNIRRAHIHHFFPEASKVGDAELSAVVELTVDREDPRRWYWALMDYGSSMKWEATNPNRRSSHYRKQPPFAGSDRQLRGRIIALLVDHPPLAGEKIANLIDTDPERVKKSLGRLAVEGLVREEGGFYRIA